MLISLYLKLFVNVMGNMGELGGGVVGGGYWSVDYLCMYTKTYQGKRYVLAGARGRGEVGGKEGEQDMNSQDLM